MNNIDIHSTAKVYKGSEVINSKLKKFSSLGDFSRIKFSELGEHSRIGRYNYIEESIIGKYSYTGMNTTIVHSKIGNFCSISWSVSIGGANHDYTRVAQHSFLYDDWSNIRKNSKPEYDRFSDGLTIGNDVWIGTGAVVTRDVSIGDGAAIGANAVVTRDVPPYAIVVGAPAKVIKYRFDREIIDLLLEMKWWNWSNKKLRDNYNILKTKPSVSKLKKLV